MPKYMMPFTPKIYFFTCLLFSFNVLAFSVTTSAPKSSSLSLNVHPEESTSLKYSTDSPQETLTPSPGTKSSEDSPTVNGSLSMNKSSERGINGSLSKTNSSEGDINGSFSKTKSSESDINGSLSKSNSSEKDRALNRPHKATNRTKQKVSYSSDPTKPTTVKDQQKNTILTETTRQPKIDLSSEITKSLNRPQAQRQKDSNPREEDKGTDHSFQGQTQSTALPRTTTTERGANAARMISKEWIERMRSKNRPLRNRNRNSRVKHRRRNRPRKYRHSSRIRMPHLREKGHSGQCPHANENGGRQKNKHDSPDDCPNCGTNKELTEEEVREERKRQFVKVMADKLRVNPKDLIRPSRRKRRAVRYPRELIDETLQDNAMEESSDEFYARDEKIVIAGVDLGRYCIAKRTSGCYKFALGSKIVGDVTKATLYVYKTPDRHDYANVPQTFILYGLEQQRSGRVLASNQQIHRHDTFVREGWVAINVTRAISAWVRQRKAMEMIAVRCSTCATRNHKALFGSKQGYTPLLVVEYDRSSILSRNRRSRGLDNCNPNYECCKRRLNINFFDLHMTTVEAPPEISVGYCYGHCEGSVRHTYNHTMLKERVRLLREDTPSYMREQLRSCCVPVVLKGTHIFIQMDGLSKKTYLPHAIVDRCGCV